MMICVNQLALWITCLQRPCRDETGQGIAEYLLLVSMVVALVLVTMNLYIGPVSALYAMIQDVFESLNKTLSL